MTAKAITEIWKDSAGLIESRVDQIESAVAELLDGGLSDEYRAAAIHAAHTLAGSVGSFGFAQAGTLAREAELLLSANAAPGPAAVVRLSAIAVRLREELTGKTVPADSPSAGAVPGTIVAIIDDVMILALLTAMLGPRGIVVHGVRISLLASEAIQRVCPHMLVVDIDTPRLNAVALCERIRSDEATAKIPILLLGLAPEQATLDALFKAGANEYVPKPVNLEELVGNITRVMPADGASTRTPAIVGADPPEALARNTDIAILDDDVVLATLLCETLQPRGLSCRVINNGIDAVGELCGKRPRTRPAVILMELSLPGLDGMAVLRVFAKDGVTRRARVVMLTARTLESEVLEALELGAHDHIAKPFSIPLLMHHLRDALPGSLAGAVGE